MPGVILDPIKDIISKPIEWIGDKISDAADWVVDEIIDPVINTVTDVVDAVLDDPLKAIAQVAAIATGNAWALPLIEGADVAIEGGDIGDILEATAMAYVTQQVGSYAGKYAGSAAASAGANQTAAQIIGTGAGQAATAVVTGQDPVKAFVTGGIQAGVQAGLGYIDAEMSGDTSGSTGAAVGDPGGVGDPGPVGQTQSFLDQNPVVKNIIADTLTTALSGQDVTGATIMNAVIKGKVTKETVKNFVDADNSLTEGQISLITSSVQNVANATFSGADASDALLGTINAYGTQELNKIIDKNVKNTIDKVTGDYQKAEAQANKIDAADKKYRDDVRRYNATANGLQNMINERDKMTVDIDTARANLQAGDPNSSSYQGLVDAYNAKVERFNSYSKYIDDYYANTFKPHMDAFKKDIDDQFAAIEADSVIYQDLKNELVSSSDQLDDVMIKVDNATQKAYVRAMTGDEFNAKEYKEINDLGDISDDEARFHWLTEGKDKKLNVNKVNYDKEAAAKEQSLFMQLVKETGLPVTALTQDQIKEIQQKIKATETVQTYISDSLKGKFVEDDFIVEGTIDDFEVFEDIKEELSAYTGDPGLAPKDYVLNEGVTDVDIGTGRAVLQPNENAELVWTIPELDVSKWDNDTGTTTPSNIATTEGGTLEQVAKTNAGAFVNIMERVSDDDAATIASTNPQFGLAHDVINQVKEFADSKSEGGAEGREQRAKDMLSGTLTTDVAGTLLEEAGSSIARAWGGTLALINQGSKYTSVGAALNPELQKAYDDQTTNIVNTTNTAAEWISGVGKNLQSEDWKKNAQEVSEQLKRGNSVQVEDEKGNLVWVPKTNEDGSKRSIAGQILDSTSNFFGTLGDHPSQVLTRHIGAEVVENIVGLGAGSVVGKYTKVKALADGALDDVAELLATKANLATQVVVDGVEIAGNVFTETYNEIYKKALEMGQNEGDAAAYARDVATNTSVPTLLVHGLTNKFLGGSSLEEVTSDFVNIAGKKTDGISEWVGRVYKSAKAVGAEALQEGIESTTASLAKIWGTPVSQKGMLDLDPYHYEKQGTSASAEVINSAVIEAAVGAKSSAVTALAYTAGDPGETSYQPDYINQLYRSTSQGGMTLEQAKEAYSSQYGAPAELNSPQANALIKFNPQVSNIIYTAGDAEQAAQQLENLGLNDNVLKTDVLNTKFDSVVTTSTEAREQFVEANPEYKYSESEIEDFTGFTTDNDFDIETYVDDRFFDTEEVKEVAEAEGVTLTDLQMERLSGQKDPVAATTTLQKTLDSKATTYAEAEKYLTDLNYNPTVEEINNFVRQVNNEELTDADLGITDVVTEPDPDVAPPPTYEEEVAEEIKQYAEDRLTTEEEVVTELEDEGFDVDKLPDNFVDQFVKQGLQTDTLKEVIEAANPFMVTAKEVSEAYKEAGLPDVRPEDVDALVGQYNQEELDARLKEALPAAQYNTLKYDIGQLSDKLGGDVDTLGGQISDVTADVDTLGGQISDVTADVAGLDVNIQSIADIIGKPATEVTDVDVDFVADLIAQTEVLSDPSTFQFTDEQLGYDVTGDGIVDINDQNLLNNALQGQDVAFAPESRFQPATGIFAQIDAQNQAQIDAQAQMQAQIDAQNQAQAEAQAQIAAQNQAQIDAQAQIAQQIEVNELRNKRMGNVRDLQNMLVEDASRVTTVKSQPVAEIGDPYDFASIFRDSGQDAFYRSPYAQGGIVDVNEELLRLIGGK